MLKICGWVLLCKVIDNFPILLHVTGQWRPPLSRDKMEPRHGIMKAFPKVKRAKVLHGKDAPPVKKKPDECDVTGLLLCLCVWVWVREYKELCKTD